jgi:hypothetical protein
VPEIAAQIEIEMPDEGIGIQVEHPPPHAA